MASRSRWNARNYKTREVLEKEIEENLIMLGKDIKQAHVSDYEINGNKAKATSAGSFVIAEPNQIESEFRPLS